MLESAFANRTVAGWRPAFAYRPLASLAASALSEMLAMTSKTSNTARAHTPFACVPRASGRYWPAASLDWIVLMPFTIAVMSADSVRLIVSRSGTLEPHQHGCEQQHDGNRDDEAASECRTHLAAATFGGEPGYGGSDV